MQRLLGEATEEQLTRVIGRVNGPRVFTLLNENSSDG